MQCVACLKKSKPNQVQSPFSDRWKLLDFSCLSKGLLSNLRSECDCQICSDACGLCLLNAGLMTCRTNYEKADIKNNFAKGGDRKPPRNTKSATRSGALNVHKHEAQSGTLYPPVFSVCNATGVCFTTVCVVGLVLAVTPLHASANKCIRSCQHHLFSFLFFFVLQKNAGINSHFSSRSILTRPCYVELLFRFYARIEFSIWQLSLHT